MANTLAFRNSAQAALFQYELAGQISDGYWENSRPFDHWKPWCNAHVIVDPANLGKDFYAGRESYNFTSKDLLDVVSERMIYKARVATVFGPETLRHINWKIEGGKLKLPPKPTGTDKYYNDEYEAISKLPIDEINKVLADDTIYFDKMLMRDLKDMKVIIKMRRK